MFVVQGKVYIQLHYRSLSQIRRPPTWTNTGTSVVTTVALGQLAFFKYHVHIPSGNAFIKTFSFTYYNVAPGGVKAQHLWR